MKQLMMPLNEEKKVSMYSFGLAVVKAEGSWIRYPGAIPSIRDDEVQCTRSQIRYARWSYLERNIPNALHDYINDVIDEQIRLYLLIHPDEK